MGLDGNIKPVLLSFACFPSILFTKMVQIILYLKIISQIRRFIHLIINQQQNYFYFNNYQRTNTLLHQIINIGQKMGQNIQLPEKVEGKNLLSKLHRSIGALKYLNRYKFPHAGSAVLLSKNIALTSAQNVFDRTLQAENQDFKIFFGANGIAKEEDGISINDIRFMKQYRNCPESSRIQFEFALLKLEKQVPFKQYLQLSVPCQICLNDKKQPNTLQIFGFPANFRDNYESKDKYGNEFILYQYGLARQNRIIAIEPSQKYKIGYAIRTQPGQNGCPVAIGQNIIAIHNGCGKSNEQFNVGRLIDLPLITQLQDWCRQLNGHPFSINYKNLCPHLSPTVKRHLEEKQIIKTQTKLDRSNQNIKEIEIKEYVNLTHLYLQNNQLSAIDVTNNNNLTSLYLSNNQLSAIDVTKNIILTRLYLSNNQLFAIDVTNNIHLAHLYLSNNQISAINATKNINLTRLHLQKNQLSAIDVTNNINLISLYLSNNQLSAIDVTKNINLTSLYLSNNEFSATDVTNNINLTHLYCQNNQLSAIDVTKNSKLDYLFLQNNIISKVSFWLSPQKPISDYLSSDYNFFHQRSDICEVQIEINSESEAKFSQLREKWTQEYQQGNIDYNQHNCKYVFTAVKR